MNYHSCWKTSSKRNRQPDLHVLGMAEQSSRDRQYLIIPTLPTFELPPKREHTCLTTSHSLGGQVFPTSSNPFVAKRQPTGREDLRYSASKRIHVLTCNVDPCFLGSPMVESDHLDHNNGTRHICHLTPRSTTVLLSKHFKQRTSSWAIHSFKNTLYPSNTSQPSNCLPPSWSGM